MRRHLAPFTALTLIVSALAAPAAAAAGWNWPVSGDVITPYRNGTDPYATGQHRGIDIAAPTGTPVVAATGGEVRFAGTAGSSGLTVSIRTGDGYDTSYLHLSSLAVRAGARVGAGDRVGSVGTTGTRSAVEPHLHFGVRDVGTRHAYNDPMRFLPPLPPAPRAPEPPPPATAPKPAPAPPALAPVPARRPDAAPRASPRAAPRTDPRAAPRSLPRAAPRPVSHPTPGARPVPVARIDPRPSAAVAAPGSVGATGRNAPADHRGIQAEADGSRRAGAPAAGPVRELGGSRRTAVPPTGMSARDLRPHSTATDGARRSGSSAPGGPNVGWALACAGLLLAAGVLGLAEGGRRPARRALGRGRERRAVRRPRVASMAHAVLRDDAHLLRQR